MAAQPPGQRPVDVIETIGTFLIALVVLLGSGYLIVTLPSNEAIIALVSAQVGAVVAFFFSAQANASQRRAVSYLVSQSQPATAAPPSPPVSPPGAGG